jgi:16S rRNA (cytosine967-C5)-methyltransferase
MTPAARVAAAIEVIESVLDGQATEAALLQWARGSRYAGSKDRAAVRDLVFEARRKWASSRAIGGADTGRAVMLGLLVQTDADIAALFSGVGYGIYP